MIRQDLIQKVCRAHDEAVAAAGKWNYAAGAGHKTDGPYKRYEKAEQKFEKAIAALVDAAN